ncbi:hypothetical protein GCM10009647_051130 [Streptomyces sanglieri]
MQKESTRFKNRTWDVAADLRLPDGFDPAKKYPAIICAHPISSCKEQTSGNVYAERLTELGYVTLAFDASHQGKSGGEPRYLEDPATRVEDFSCAVDLVTLDHVDEDRIGLVGICGGGGYAAKATMTDHRIKALGTVVAANYGRITREGNLTPHAAIDTLEAIGKQRTAEARGAEPLITTYIPNSPEEREQAGVSDIDIVNAVEYYRTSRAQNPNGASAFSRSTCFRGTRRCPSRAWNLPCRREIEGPHGVLPPLHRPRSSSSAGVILWMFSRIHRRTGRSCCHPNRCASTHRPRSSPWTTSPGASGSVPSAWTWFWTRRKQRCHSVSHTGHHPGSTASSSSRRASVIARPMKGRTAGRARSSSGGTPVTAYALPQPIVGAATAGRSRCRGRPRDRARSGARRSGMPSL